MRGTACGCERRRATTWRAGCSSSSSNDLARWLFQLIVELEGGVTTRLQCLELMAEVMLVVQPLADDAPSREAPPEGVSLA
jgi:hypothetical protein